jgi:hypothetical protein
MWNGTRMEGMANPGELSINVVTTDKLKTRKGLSQEGNVVGTGTSCYPVMDTNATGGKREPNPFGYSD